MALVLSIEIVICVSVGVSAVTRIPRNTAALVTTGEHLPTVRSYVFVCIWRSGIHLTYIHTSDIQFTHFLLEFLFKQCAKSYCTLYYCTLIHPVHSLYRSSIIKFHSERMCVDKWGSDYIHTKTPAYKSDYCIFVSIRAYAAYLLTYPHPWFPLQWTAERC